jgi:mono/diheme cytochrome c family protein
MRAGQGRWHGVGRPLVLALSLFLAGCSGGGEPTSDSDTGAAVFADAGCGGCHALSAAGSNGTAGPSLDALKPDAERVERQVVSGGRGMPAFGGRLTDEEIRRLEEEKVLY